MTDFSSSCNYLQLHNKYILTASILHRTPHTTRQPTTPGTTGTTFRLFVTLLIGVCSTFQLFISCHVYQNLPIKKFSYYSILKSEIPVASAQKGDRSISHSIHDFMKVLFTHRRNNDFTRDKQQDSGRNTGFKI